MLPGPLCALHTQSLEILNQCSHTRQKRQPRAVSSGWPAFSWCLAAHAPRPSCRPIPPGSQPPSALCFPLSQPTGTPKHKSLGGVGAAAGREGGHKEEFSRESRDGNSQNAMRPLPGCLGSLGGGTAPATRDSVATVFLPSSLLFTLCQDQEYLLEKGEWGEVSWAAGYLPFFSGTVQPWALGACKGTRAHTRARAHTDTHTHTTRQPRSRPPRPPPLCTSSCQNAALDPPIPPCSRPRAGFATTQQFGK